MVKRWIALLLAVLLLLGAAGCSKDSGESSQGEDSAPVTPEPDAEYPVRVGAVSVDARPGKVVSLAPAITEKLFDLGMGERLMGVSDRCDYPAQATALPAYGLPQSPDIDGLRELAPQVILTVSDPPEAVAAAIADMGATLVVIPSYSGTLEELENVYITLAMVLEGRTTGRAMGELFVQNFEAELDRIAGLYAAEDPLNALYLRFMPKDSDDPAWPVGNVATGDTLEGELLERVGFVNAAAGQEGWIFEPTYAQSTDGRALFEELDIYFMDERDVQMQTHLEKSEFYRRLQATLKDWYIYIDAIAFERQSLRMLPQLEKMVGLDTVGENPYLR